MSDFCENYNPHSSYHTTAIGECLVDIWFAETCKLTMFTFLKIFIGLKNGSLLHAQTAFDLHKFEHAVLYVVLLRPSNVWFPTLNRTRMVIEYTISDLMFTTSLYFFHL